MMRHNEKGFILLDCIVSLVVLSVVICSFLMVLPVLLSVKQDMELNHDVKMNLYAIKHQLLDGKRESFTQLSLTSPVAQTITNANGTLCTRYVRRDGVEVSYCLPQ